jgi:hypothetical protein
MIGDLALEELQNIVSEYSLQEILASMADCVENTKQGDEFDELIYEKAETLRQWAKTIGD